MKTIIDNEELRLRELTQASPGKHTPFRVPDGYFTTLQSRVMDRIKAEEATKTQSEASVHGHKAAMTAIPSLPQAGQERHLWVRLTAAAVFTGVISVLGTMMYHHHSDTIALPTENLTSMSAATDIEYTDELLDYAMLSNTDIAYYLTSAE